MPLEEVTHGTSSSSSSSVALTRRRFLRHYAGRKPLEEVTRGSGFRLSAPCRSNWNYLVCLGKMLRPAPPYRHCQKYNPFARLRDLDTRGRHDSVPLRIIGCVIYMKKQTYTLISVFGNRIFLRCPSATHCLSSL